MSEFGDELRRLRVLAGLTQGQVARHVGYGIGSVSNWERGPKSPPRDVVQALDDRLHGSGVLVVLWEEHTRTRGVPAHLRDDVALGERARTVEVVTPVLVPGILQVPSYARAALVASRPGDPMEVVERLVEARCGVLGRMRARVTAVFPSSGLYAVPSATADQASHLVQLVDSGRVTVHLIPGAPLGVGTPWTLYTLADGTRAATTEHALGSVVADPPGAAHLFDKARSALGWALPPDESARVLKEAVEHE